MLRRYIELKIIDNYCEFKIRIKLSSLIIGAPLEIGFNKKNLRRKFTQFKPPDSLV